jgi:hypothetical protein
MSGGVKWQVGIVAYGVLWILGVIRVGYFGGEVHIIGIGYCGGWGYNQGCL